MKRSMALLLGVLAVVALVGAAEAVDDNDEFIDILWNRTVPNSTVNLSVRYTGFDGVPGPDQSELSRLHLKLCRQNEEPDSVSRECWRGPSQEWSTAGGLLDNIGPNDAEQGACTEDAHDLSTSQRWVCWTEITMPPEQPRPMRFIALLEVNHGTLQDNTFMYDTATVRIANQSDTVRQADHSFTSLDEAHTNDLLLWGIVAVVSLYFGWWFPAFTASFMGVLGVMIQNPPEIMQFKAVALWTLMAFWLQFIAVNFEAMKHGVPFLGNPSPQEREDREER